MNRFIAIHGDELIDPPIYWNIQPPAAHFKSSSSPPNTIPVVSYIMGRINHHAIDNGDVEFHPSYFPVYLYSESVPYLVTTPVKSIDDY